jgi:hypothetical protein
MASDKEHQKKMNSLQNDLQYMSLQGNINRARSITVGTAFGGAIEICMRTDLATYYAQLQPVEAIEVIESLASACGLQIALRPKQDFSAWRDWHVDEENIGVIWKGSSPWQTKSFQPVENSGQYLPPENSENAENIEEPEENLQEQNIEEPEENLQEQNIELSDGTQITYSE